MSILYREYPLKETPPQKGERFHLILTKVPADLGEFRREILRRCFLEWKIVKRMLEDLPALLMRDLGEAEAIEKKLALEKLGAGLQVCPSGTWKKVYMEIPTRKEEIAEGAARIDRLLERSGLDSQDASAMATACREALANAAMHGNQDNPAKKIRLTYVRDPQKITFSVIDEGKGFDHRELSRNLVAQGDAIQTTRKRQEQGLRGGLGILLMSRCVDRIEFNEDGNEIKLIKRIS
jgi:serine/threonine-protein kinase RsbW